MKIYVDCDEKKVFGDSISSVNHQNTFLDQIR